MNTYHRFSFETRIGCITNIDGLYQIPNIGSFAASLLIVPLMLRAGLSQDIVAAFNFRFIRDFARRMWKDILVAGVFLLVAGLVAHIVGLLLLCVAFSVFVARKWWQRQRVVRSLKMPRMSVEVAVVRAPLTNQDGGDEGVRISGFIDRIERDSEGRSRCGHPPRQLAARRGCPPSRRRTAAPST